MHNRVLSLAEIRQLADPSNVMLSGLILPPRRRLFAAGVAGGTAYTWTTTAGAFVLSGKPIVQRVARPDTTRRDPTRPDAT